MASATTLTRNDSAVLSALFDPEASLDGAPQISQSAIPAYYNNRTIREIQKREHEALTKLNTDSPSRRDLEIVLAELNELIDEYPHYASAYNNRAQTRRMLLDLHQPESNTTSMPLIFADLAHAIRLASPTHPIEPIHAEQARVLASAHTHRAYILYKASRSSSARSKLDGVTGFSCLDTSQLEEMASRDFAAGGRYGNKIAKQLAVQTNPYAKLCGSIAREALRKEMEKSQSGM